MAAMLKKSFTLNLSPYHITIEQFDQICTLRARFINLWAKDYAIDIQSVASAAFLMESGKIIISNIIAQNNYTTRFEELLLTNSIEDAEKLLFNVDSYTIAGMLFREWEFEEGFIEMIMGVSHPKTLEQQLLHVSSVLISTDGILTDVNIKKALLLLNRYELLHKNFSATVLELQKKSD